MTLCTDDTSATKCVVTSLTVNFTQSILIQSPDILRQDLRILNKSLTSSLQFLGRSCYRCDQLICLVFVCQFSLLLLDFTLLCLEMLATWGKSIWSLSLHSGFFYPDLFTAAKPFTESHTTESLYVTSYCLRSHGIFWTCSYRYIAAF